MGENNKKKRYALLTRGNNNDQWSAIVIDQDEYKTFYEKDLGQNRKMAEELFANYRKAGLEIVLCEIKELSDSQFIDEMEELYENPA